jgi:uncharacterized membrane protein
MHAIEASIMVSAPASECYRHWRAFERFPTFVRRIISVRSVSPSELTGNVSVDPRAQDPQKNFENTMNAEILHEVAAHGNRVWRWTVKGPFGQMYTWTAGVVMDEPNKAISWSTTCEQPVACSGTVNFLPQRAAKDLEYTLIDLRATFSPPAGPLGELVADIIGYGDTLAQECLEDFKRYVEVNQPTEPPPKYSSLS